MLEVVHLFTGRVKGSLNSHLALAVSLTGKDRFSLSLSFFLFLPVHILLLLLSYHLNCSTLCERVQAKQGISAALRIVSHWEP